MGRNVLNLTRPEPRQIWQHVTSKVNLLIISTDSTTARCAILDEAGKASHLRVDIPLDKFKFYSNRGLKLVGSKSGTLPKPGAAGDYNPRLLNLGAL